MSRLTLFLPSSARFCLIRCPSRRSRCEERTICSLRAVTQPYLDRRRISSVLTTIDPSWRRRTTELFPTFHTLFIPNLLLSSSFDMPFAFAVIRGFGQPRVSYETDLSTNSGVSLFFLCNELFCPRAEHSLYHDEQRLRREMGEAPAMMWNIVFELPHRSICREGTT